MKRLLIIVLTLAVPLMAATAATPVSANTHCPTGSNSTTAADYCATGQTGSRASSNNNSTCPDGVQTSFFGCVQKNEDSTDLNDNPIYKLLLNAINFLAVGVGIVVVGGIVYGSFLIVNSNANAGRTQQGISIIVNAFIGLLLYIFLFAIVNYLVPGGLFT